MNIKFPEYFTGQDFLDAAAKRVQDAIAQAKALGLPQAYKEWPETKGNKPE